jgi:hypothetical protein
MSQCEDINEMMVEALYDDLDGDRKAEFDAHLKSCSDCARLYKQMAGTLRLMSARETAEPDEAYWAGYSERLDARLESEEKISLRKIRPAWHTHPVLRVGAIAALLMVGIFLGRWIWSDERPPEQVPDMAVSTQRQADVANTLVDDRVQSYLQKSQVLLLALNNFDPQTDDAVTLNLSSQKRISEFLVQEAAYLKTALTDDPAQVRLRELVTDLEIILLQIANLEDEHDLEAVEMVQMGVEKQGVLFRIDLSKISSERPDASPSAKPTSLKRT